MASIEVGKLHAFLTELGKQYNEPAKLFLLGGSALVMLGSPRQTADIDYVGHDLHKDDFQLVIEQLAQSFQLDVEAVPIEEFIPVPADAHERHILIAEFEQVEVYVFDPYSIAISKLDRGFDTDIADVVFMLDQQLITMEQLELLLHQALKQAHAFDLSPATANRHLEVVRQRIASRRA